MAKTLVIDSHKSSNDKPAANLHWQNARMIADALDGDLIWSYPTVNDNVHGGYDSIVFVHASHYAYTDYAWLEASPNAKLYYVTNEYNLGEPRTLWMAAKAGRKYTVLANHPHHISKVVMKYVDDWQMLNLNALVYGNYTYENARNRECVYYGSYRDDRKKYFKKYFDGLTVSTHSKNRPKIDLLDVAPKYVNRLDIQNGDLAQFGFSLYIEDEKTHTAYNYLANRFYESLNSGALCLFDESCENTLGLCGYPIERDQVIKSSTDMLDAIDAFAGTRWSADILAMAAKDKQLTLDTIRSIVS
ncbi:MAG: hypothetical protein ITD33_03845 [Nitrosarchaeum sp.]|nr:hypothetical protein [Nitrosarchaeum sp.]